MKKINTILISLLSIIILSGCSFQKANSIEGGNIDLENSGTIEQNSGGENPQINIEKNTIYLGNYNNQRVLYIQNINNYEKIISISNGEDIIDTNFGLNTQGYKKLSQVEKVYKLDFQDSINNEDLVSIKEYENKIYFSIIKNKEYENDIIKSTTYIKSYNISTKQIEDVFSLEKEGSLGINIINGIYIALKDYPCRGCGLGNEPLKTIILNTKNKKTLELGMVGDINFDIEKNIVKYSSFEKSYEGCDEQKSPMDCNLGKREIYKLNGKYTTQKLP